MIALWLPLRLHLHSLWWMCVATIGMQFSSITLFMSITNRNSHWIKCCFCSSLEFKWRQKKNGAHCNLYGFSAHLFVISCLKIQALHQLWVGRPQTQSKPHWWCLFCVFVSHFRAMGKYVSCVQCGLQICGYFVLISKRSCNFDFGQLLNYGLFDEMWLRWKLL